MSRPVLGIDPGTAVTGYGLVAPGGPGPGRLIECGVIRSNPKMDPARRLRSVFEGICEVIERGKPVALAVEGVFYNKNARSTIQLAQARGVVLLAGSLAGLEIHEYAPASVKRAIAGTGRARKEQVAYMVQQLLRLKTPPSPADAADGVALALTHLLASRVTR